MTLLSRHQSIVFQIEEYPFWSYVAWLKGDGKIGLEIIKNIILFIPFGFGVGYIFKGKFFLQVVGGLLLSISIESVQLLFHLGLFEIDDIVSNSIGTSIGAYIFLILRGKTFFRKFVSFFFVLGGIVVCISTAKQEPIFYEKQFYFDVQDIVISKEAQFEYIKLVGDCFIYADSTGRDYEILLKTNDSYIKLVTQIVDSDSIVSSYYTDKDIKYNTGYVANGKIDSKKIYEILIKWKGLTPKTTGQYIINGRVVFSSEIAPFYSGTLVMANTKRGYYIFQNRNQLYWLIDEANFKEDSNRTKIELQLWTTEPWNLPEERLKHGWDDRAFIFEENEIQKSGRYRVAKTELPVEYPITAIETGNYQDGKWIWKDCFRPIINELTIGN